ncbi:MAG: response regulator [Chloroflexota bacterium]
MENGEKIRVLIVDDIAETRENLRKLLQFEPDVEVVGAANTGREGIRLAEETKPEVVLMDINMPDMDGIAATEAIRRKVPFAQVVILSVQSDANYMRRAMLVGARDFLTKPPSVDELTATIRRAAKMAREERSKAAPAVAMRDVRGITGPLFGPPQALGKVIMVYSPKGGVGCTTVATNLAVLLHNQDTPVVLVDCELQFGDIPIFMNEQIRNSILDLAPRTDELDPEVIEEVLIHHKPTGVKILSAPQRPEDAENISGEQVVKVLNYIKQLYSYVIVDTGSALNDITLGALEIADVIILLTSQDIPSIKNARLFLDLTDAFGIERGHIIFALNKYDKRIGITSERIGESLKQDIVAVIPQEERVIVAINRGVPFVLEEKGRPFTQGMLILSKAVRQRLAELEAQAEMVQEERVLRR